MKQRGFTLIEILIVVIIIGLIMALIPFRMKSLQQQTQVSLIGQQRETVRDDTLLHMRQGPGYDTATISLSTTGVVISYGGALGETGVQTHAFEPVLTAVSPENAQWSIPAYALGCTGTQESRIIYEGREQCYAFFAQSCSMQAVVCP